MKPHLFLFFLTLTITLFSCRKDPVPGPQGPRGFDGAPGPRGPQGIPGPEGPQGLAGETAYVWEINVNFTPEGGYEYLWEFPEDFAVYDQEKVLVYFLTDEYDNGTEYIDVWTPLPLLYFREQGQVYYSYDFTKYDVNLKMEATSNDLYIPKYTDDWIARIVVVPTEAMNFNLRNNEINWDDYYAVKEHFNLAEPTQDKRPVSKRD